MEQKGLDSFRHLTLHGNTHIYKDGSRFRSSERKTLRMPNKWLKYNLLPKFSKKL